MSERRWFWGKSNMIAKGLTLAAVVMRLGGRGAVGRFALTSNLVFFAAVAVVPTGRAAVGEVKIAVAAFVHGVRLLRLKVV